MVGKEQEFDRRGCMGLAAYWFIELPAEIPQDMQEYLVGRLSRKLFV